MSISLIRLGRLTPASTSILLRSSKVSARLQGVPPNMSVAMTTPLPDIHRLGRRRDLALAALDIVLGPDADGAQMGLRPHHMLHRRNEFLGEAAMGNENKSDHE